MRKSKKSLVIHYFRYNHVTFIHINYPCTCAYRTVTIYMAVYSSVLILHIVGLVYYPLGFHNLLYRDRTTRSASRMNPAAAVVAVARNHVITTVRVAVATCCT